MKTRTREAGLRLAILSVALGVAFIATGFLLSVGGVWLVAAFVLVVLYLCMSWRSPTR